ncbi:AMP-binding protein [Streptomyces sp. M19]
MLYGPTELTISCTAYRLPRSDQEWPKTINGIVPIGTCHPSMDHVLLDEAGRPGTTGELCVRGPQRFSGYLDPANNTGRFLLLDDTGQARTAAAGTPVTDGHWYRTGDRATMDGGVLVHLGRIDQQVKIRGHRIELGEVEALLRTRREWTTRSYSPWTAGTGSRAGSRGHRPRLRQPPAVRRPRGPPSPLHAARRIVAFDELPLNANGKIDRRALLEALGDSRH